MTGLAFLEWGVESWEDGKEGGGTKLSALGLQWLGQEVFRAINVMYGRLSVDAEGLGVELGRMSRDSEGSPGFCQPWLTAKASYKEPLRKKMPGGRETLEQGV
jgi:hypothetical protein